MVSFKRKPVKIPPPQFTPVDKNQPVWVIEQTLEYFATYEAYLARLDFYNQRKFVCELTGNSCLTYFEALEKEAKEARSIMVDFPEPPKEPILKKVQFSTNSRLDLLVDEVYAMIRYEFYIGEMVHARTRDQQRVRVQVNEILPPKEGSTEKRYRCSHEFNPSIFEVYEGTDLFRDRKTFNKMSVRTFIKYAASRDNWAGAPWIVRKEYVDRYPNIPTTPPPELDAIISRKGQAPDKDGTIEPSTPELASAPSTTIAPSRRRKAPVKAVETVMDRSVDDLDVIAAATINPVASKKFLDWPHWLVEQALEQDVIGKALQVWTFINVYNEMLIISPITFDKFLQALNGENSEDIGEIICAILTIFVDPNEDILAVPFPSQYEPSIRGRKSKRQKVDDGEMSEAANDNESMAEEEEEGDDDPISSEAPEAENNAEDYIQLGGDDWMVRIGKRDFTNGGWQSLVICTLFESCYLKEWLPSITSLLTVLADSSTRASLKTAEKNWDRLSSSQKVEILFILVQILHTSPSVRLFMEVRSDSSTKARKERAEATRELRALGDTIKALREKKALENLESIDKEIARAVVKQNRIGDKLLNINNELVRFDCQRMRFLGKDRFYNRFWYMEANGLPRPAVNQDGKTEPLYMMGRIWVQGPSPEDYEKCLNNVEINARITQARDRAYEASYNAKVRAILEERERAIALKRAAIIKAENADKAALTRQAIPITPQRERNTATRSNRGTPQNNQQRQAAVQPPSAAYPFSMAPQPQAPPQPQPQPPVQSQPQAQPSSQHQTPIYQPQVHQMPQMQHMAMQMPGRPPMMMAPAGMPAMQYFPQPMHPMQQQYMMPMAMPQYPPHIMGAQQMIYMVPQNVNGMNTLVPMAIPGMMPGQQFPHAFAQGQVPLPAQFQDHGAAGNHSPHLRMQPIPQPMQQVHQLPQIQPIQQSTHSGLEQAPMKVEPIVSSDRTQNQSPGSGNVSPKTTISVVPAVNGNTDGAPKALPGREGTAPDVPNTNSASPTTKEESIAPTTEMVEPESDAMDIEVEQPSNGTATESIKQQGSHGEEDDSDVEMKTEEIAAAQDSESVSEKAEAESKDGQSHVNVESGAAAQPTTPTYSNAPSEGSSANTAAAVEPHNGKENISTDIKDESSETEDESPALPEKETFEPLSALELKKQIEGEFILTKPDQWRYYDNENDLNRLILHLTRGGSRECELLEKLYKFEESIRAGMRNRAQVLEGEATDPWINELAKEKIGQFHRSARPRRRGKR